MAAIPNDERPPRVALGLYKRFALGLLTIFLSTTAAVATAALLEIKSGADIFSSFSKQIPGIDRPGVLDDVDPGGPQTILVLGSDRRFVDIKAKTPTRSDTIILLRLDPSKGA
nr:LytR family transcriptional regulator [Solirubrobacterales bacterium]